MVEQVVATEAAIQLANELKAEFGEVFFHQSGGCCDNSAANCYKKGDFQIGAADQYLGDIAGIPFYIGKLQFEYWKHTQLIIDAIEAHGGGTFSLDTGKDRCFLTRSRLFTDEEFAWLQANGKV